MEKISGILPKSPRLASVDETASQPARPGAPTQGRVEGANEIRDRVTLSSAAKAKDIKEVSNYGRNKKDAEQAKIVEEMSRKFFMREAKPIKAESIAMTIEPVAVSTEPASLMTDPEASVQ